MRERVVDIADVGYGSDRDQDDDRPRRRSFWSRLIHWHLREWLMVGAIMLAVGTVMVNALFMQTGSHPAPMFVNRQPPPAPATDTARPMVVPRPRPAETRSDQKTEMTMPVRTRAEVIADIQRELALRGFYDGLADGVYGPKTDIAVRDFEHAASLRPSTEPNENLRRTIARSTVKAPVVPARDTTGSATIPSKRVIALQRALADYGYGQIRPTGQYDPQTRDAIEQFERSRKLPVTGQISERVTRELAAMTGRPLE